MSLRYAHRLSHDSVALYVRVALPYVIAASQHGGTTVLEFQSGGGELRYTLKLGSLWDVVCFQDRLVVANSDGVVRLWSLATRELLHKFQGHVAAVRAVLMPNSETVISSARDGELRIWDVSSGQCRHVLVGHTSDIPCLAAHGDVLVSGGNDLDVRVWDITSGQCIQVLEGHDTAVGILGFNQDFTLLAVGGSGGALKIWRLHDGVKLAEYVGHTKLPTVFLNLNGLLLSAGADGTVREWEWDSGRQVKALRAHDDKAIRGMMFVSGQFVTAGMDGRIKLWDDSRSRVTEEISAGDHIVIWTLQKLSESCFIGTVKPQDRSQFLKIWDVPNSQRRETN